MSPADSISAPDEASALLQQAFDAHRRADLGEAERLYRAVAALNAKDPRALANLGALALQQGRAGEALAWLDQALAIRPDQTGVLANRAGALRALGRPLEALETVRRALTLDPAFADGLNTLGLLLTELGRPSEAIAPLEEAVRLVPGQPVFRNTLGIALSAAMRPEEALSQYEDALALAPGYLEARSNRAAALRVLGRLEEALAACEALLASDPGHLDAWVNRACILRDLGRHEEALVLLQQVCAAAPEHVEAHFSLAYELLAAGRWDEGWPLFEWRWRRPEFQPIVGRAPGAPWLGQTPIAGKTLLLHYEQGLGDSLQMLRYLDEIAERGGKAILAVQPPLMALVRDLPSAALALTDGDPLPAYDLHCPLMSLPLAFGTRLETVPWRGPYLAAPPEAAARWKARLDPLPRPRIGLAWSGNPRQANDRNRSMPLEALGPLLEADATFISLQKEYRPGDRERLAGLGVVDVSAELDDLAETAGLIGQLDAVVTVCTSVAHLAGAMGKPGLLLLCFAADFRWLNTGEHSPWYPSLRLLRQGAPGDWSSPVRRAVEAIPGLVGQPG